MGRIEAQSREDHIAITAGELWKVRSTKANDISVRLGRIVLAAISVVGRSENIPA